MAITAISTGVAAFTFTEQPARRTYNKFGEVEVLTEHWLGQESIFTSYWVNIFTLGSQPVLPTGLNNFFLISIERNDAGGGLLDITLTYLGGESVSRSPGGVVYSNLKVNVELLSKSFSWQGAAKIGSSAGVLITLSYSAQYGTLEATFNYTAYTYPNGGQWRAQAINLVGLPTGPFWYYTEQLLILTGVTSYIIVPTIINPQLVLSRFTAKQQSSVNLYGKYPTVYSASSIWDVQETWSLEYNMNSLGVLTQNYSFS